MCVYLEAVNQDVYSQTAVLSALPDTTAVCPHVMSLYKLKSPCVYNIVYSLVKHLG